MLNWDELVETFTRVTNLPAVYKDVSYDEWIEKVPFKNVPVARNVPEGRSFSDNFRAWWRLYHDDIIERDMEWIKKVNPERVTIENWIRQTGYDGTRKSLLKDVEDGWQTPSTYEKK